MNEKRIHCNETNKQSTRDNIEEDDEQKTPLNEKSGTDTSLAKNEGGTVLPSSRNDGCVQYAREVKNSMLLPSTKHKEGRKASSAHVSKHAAASRDNKSGIDLPLPRRSERV